MKLREGVRLKPKYAAVIKIIKLKSTFIIIV